MRLRVSEIIRSTLDSAQADGSLKSLELPNVIVERSRKVEFGDYATNVAMLLAPREKRPPRDIAEVLSKMIEADASIEKCEVAGPGFINIFLKSSYWTGLLADILSKGAGYGRSEVGKGKRVQVEFVSANPTGPLHIGHGRGAAVGDALANILKCAGYEVTKEYYINDVGNQMVILANSVYLRYMELLNEKIDFPDDHYKGDYIKDVAGDLLKEHGEKYKDAKEGEYVEELKGYASTHILDDIKDDLKKFGVEFDTWKSEASLLQAGLVEETINILREKGHVFDKDGAVWFKSTEFGDDKDRVLIKADGALTYFASDVAYHREKIERGFDTIVDIWGADHHGYLKRIKALFTALQIEGVDEDTLKVIFIQLVSLLRDGEPVAMSTRAGEFVTLKEVMDEVGTDACRFFFLMRKPDAQLDFDLELAKRVAPENPVYYVQYCHARICSILDHAKEQGVELPASLDPAIIAKLTDKDDLEIIKHLASFVEVVEASAESMEPHRINYFLQHLAGLFHPYYNRHRVVTDDVEMTQARLCLCVAIKSVAEAGLKLLGVSAPEKM